MRAALDRAAERIPGKFAPQPEVEASAQEKTGKTYRGLGLYAEARKHFKRAYAPRSRTLGAEDRLRGSKASTPKRS